MGMGGGMAVGGPEALPLMTAEAALMAAPNRLTNLVPDAAEWTEAVRIIEPHDLPDACALVLNADALKQEVLCYLERQDE